MLSKIEKQILIRKYLYEENTEAPNKINEEKTGDWIVEIKSVSSKVIKLSKPLISHPMTEKEAKDLESKLDLSFGDISANARKAKKDVKYVRVGGLVQPHTTYS